MMLVEGGSCNLMKSTISLKVSVSSHLQGHWPVIQGMDECLLSPTELTAIAESFSSSPQGLLPQDQFGIVGVRGGGGGGI